MVMPRSSVLLEEAFDWALIALSAALAAIVVAYWLHAGWTALYLRLTARTMERARRALIDVVSGRASRATVADLHRLSAAQKIRLFREFSPSLDGAQRRLLMTAATDLGVLKVAERRARSRRWTRRLQGVRLFTLLGGGEAIVPRLMFDRRPEVRAQAAEWASEHPSEDTIAALLSLLGDDIEFCRFSAKDALLRLGGVAVAPLKEFLMSNSGPAVQEGLEVAAGLAGPYFLEPSLLHCESRSPRVRGLAAILIGGIGGAEEIQRLTSMLGDDDPGVRAAAARSLGKLGHWPAAPGLARLLRDRSFAVRREAALALRALGSPGLIYLHRAVLDEDRFAADMARQVLDLPETSAFAG